MRTWPGVLLQRLIFYYACTVRLLHLKGAVTSGDYKKYHFSLAEGVNAWVIGLWVRARRGCQPSPKLSPPVHYRISTILLCVREGVWVGIIPSYLTVGQFDFRFFLLTTVPNPASNMGFLHNKKSGCYMPLFRSIYSILQVLYHRFFIFAKIILPAAVCRTLVTSTSISSPTYFFPPSTTIMVPSSR